jgi:anti-sigma B factor antagonist
MSAERERDRRASPHATSSAEAVRVCLAAGRAQVALVGELDLATAPAISRTVRHLLAAGHRHIVVDLGAVTFMDGTTVGVLVAAHREVTTSGGSLELTVHPLSARLLRLTGTTEVFGRSLRRRYAERSRTGTRDRNARPPLAGGPASLRGYGGGGGI